MSTFTVLTHYSPEWEPVAAITTPGKDAYCLRHGYRHVVQIGSYHDASLYYAVDRLHLLLDLLEGRHVAPPTDFYFVLNAPSLLTNLTTKLESFVDDTHDFYIHRDINAINAGAFIIRASEWSRRWVRFIIDDTKTHRHCWHENHSIARHCETDAWKDKVRIMPRSGFNEYDFANYSMPLDTMGQWHPGDFVLALPGMDLGKRLAYLQRKDIQDRVIT